MDESEAYDHGKFATYEVARTAAQDIVRKDLEHLCKRGMSKEELLASYAMYGEDPIVLPSEPPGEDTFFSARTYAGSIAVEICRKKIGK